MPNPTVGDVHISSALTNISVAYSQRSNFVTSMIFPTIPVVKQFDQYYVWDRQDFLRSDAQERAPGTESAGSGPRITNNSYFCKREALHQDVDDPTRANSDAAINPDSDATEYVTEQVELKIEKNWVTAFFAAGIWSGASSSTDMTGQAAPASTATNFLQWNDVASTPLQDIEGEATFVAKNSGGRRPNTLVLGPEVWTVLKHHEDVLDRIKYTERGIVTTDLLAALLDMDRVFVVWAVEDTAVEGAAASYGFLAGKSALLAYVTPSAGLKRPTAGYRFVWTGMTGVPVQGVRIKRFRMEPIESDRIEGETWVDNRVVAADLGAFFTTAVS